MLLFNRVAIITGGAKGMGKAMALKFAKEGCDIVIADISIEEADKTLSEIKEMGREGLAIECDVTNSMKVRDMVNQVISKFGKIDILVNNAGSIVEPGTASIRSVVTLSEEDWDRGISINLKGVFLCSKEVVPHMKEQKYGRIINFSSLGAISPPAPHPHYHAAKAGVLGLTYDMACELGAHNISVNAIMPGPIRTPFFDRILESKTDEEKDAFFAQLGKMAPLQRVGLPEDIAGPALFLASELSSFITGAVIPVTGGLPLQPSAETV